MKRYELPCEIVQDLLPVYIDDLANEVTAESVKSHLETCEECRRKYENMSGSELEQAVKADSAEKVEIDFLKKVRRQHKKLLFLLYCIVAAAILIFAAMKLWVRGTKCELRRLDYSITEEDGTFSFTGTMTSGAQTFTDISFREKDGVLDITLLVKDVASKYPDSVTESYTPESEITKVRLNGTVIWKKSIRDEKKSDDQDDDASDDQSGDQIDPQIVKTYEDRLQYLGDEATGSELIEDLGINDLLGGTWSSEMDLEGKSNVWILGSNTPLDETKIDAELEYDAALLIALVGDLDEVQYEFKNLAGENRTLTVNTEQASQIVGTDIKTAVANADDLQNLMNGFRADRTDLYGDYSTPAELTLHIVNKTRKTIAGMKMDLVVNEEQVLTEAWPDNADPDAGDSDNAGSDAAGKSEIGAGESADWELSQDQITSLANGLEFTLTILDENGESLGQTACEISGVVENPMEGSNARGCELTWELTRNSDGYYICEQVIE